MKNTDMLQSFSWPGPKASRFSFVITAFILLLLLLLPNLAFSAASVELTDEEKAWLAEHPEIMIGHLANWPPYSFYDASGKPVGITIDVADLVAKKTGIKFKLYPDNVFINMFEAGKSKQLDVIGSMGTQNQKFRKQWYNFSEPYLDIPVYIFTRKDDLSIQQRGDLKGKTVALLKGYWTIKHIAKAYPSATVILFDKNEDTLKAVSDGKADATIAAIGPALYLIAKHGFYNLRSADLYIPEYNQIAFGIRNDWPELVSIFNKGLASIGEDEKAAIRNKWMPGIGKQKTASQISLTAEEKAWLAKSHKVRVRMRDWPPFMFERPEPSGMAVDYLETVAQRIGLDVQFIPDTRGWPESVRD
ncbi:MAG: transporter substrate-binding domain-containing protein, partial [Sedimenticola sp.]